MAGARLDPRRQQFQERILTQLRARYPGWQFSAGADDFAAVATQGEARVLLSLTTLYQRTRLPGASVPEQISAYVAGVARRLSAQAAAAETSALDPERLVWCVRTERTIGAYSRAPELCLRSLPAGLVAFVAEALPGEVMRGVSVRDAAQAGVDQDQLTSAADRNTDLRLHRWREVLAKSRERDRWLFTEDVLFSSSLLVVPAFLRALAHRGGGRAMLSAPDRGMVVAAVGPGMSPELLRHSVRRIYTLADSPLTPRLLATDGHSLELDPSEQAQSQLPSWLSFLASRGR